MNPENFVQYIENPSFLHQLNHEELKQLILQYPYNANLRYLLVKKSQLENRGDYERNLRNAAIHSPDRKRLFKWLEEETLIEERLELKQLNEISLSEAISSKDEIILEIPKKENSEKLPIAALDTSLPFSSNSEEEELLILPLDAKHGAKRDTSNYAEPSASQETSEPLHRSQFRTWKQRYETPKIPKLTVETSSREEKAASLAETSLIEPKEIVSETLADLLTRQNQNEKAIEVYEQLALHFPEKSDFFAQQIEKLKAK